MAECSKVLAFKNLWKTLLNTLNPPRDKSVLPGRNKLSPYVFVADDAFPLSPCILKPYSGHRDKGSKNKIFIYHLSRGKCIRHNY